MGSSTGNGYRKDLCYRLTAAGAKVEYVGSQKSGFLPQNSYEGWIGFMIEQISAKADQHQALGAKPNLVLLLAGTNDLTRTPKGAPQRLQKLAEKITSRVPGTVLLIGTLPPFTAIYMPGGTGDSAPLVNDKGAKVAMANLSAVKLSDLQDGIHPKNGGYSKMAGAWFRAIENVASKVWLKN